MIEMPFLTSRSKSKKAINFIDDDQKNEARKPRRFISWELKMNDYNIP